MSLLDKMLKAGSVKGSTVLSKSSFFNTKDPIQTELPIVNIAFCGSLKGGLLPGFSHIMPPYWYKYGESMSQEEFGLYAANKLEGTYTLYNSEGVKKYQGKYSNDIKVGIWKYYKDDKSFDYQIEYIDGISQGRQDG